MIKKRNLLILLGVVVLLAAAMLIVFNLPEPSDDTAATPASTAAPAVAVFQCDAAQINEISAVNAEGEYTFIKQDGTWTVKGNPAIRIKTASVDSLASRLADVPAKQEVAAQAEDLAVYGLSQPQAVYTVTLADGGQKAFHLGNEDTVNGVYYFKLGDTPNVYTIAANTAQLLQRGLKEYRDSTLMTVSVEKLNRVVIERPQDTIELQKTEEQDASSAEIWQMVRPKEKKTDSQRLNEEILTPLGQLAITEFVYDRADKDAEYGLSTPSATLRLYDSDGASQNIYVGNKAGEGYYIRTDGSDSIYLTSADSLSFVTILPFTLIEKFISLENIDTVGSIDIVTDEAAYTMSIQREAKAESAESDDTAEEEDTATYFLNGVEVEESNFKTNLYQKVIGLTADGFSTGAKRSGIRATVVYHLLNGTVKSYDYCDYDERNYAVFDQTGNSEYFIKKKKVDDMLASVKAVAAGETPQE